MPRIQATASAVIDAPPQTVYAILADYRHGHPQILPKAYFSALVVEQGGTGAGTRIRFDIRLLGTTRSVRAAITEPEPGRVLAETDLDTGAVTTFTVVPAPGGGGTDVTITTAWTASGVRGWVEGRIAPPMLRRIYTEELQNLARHAAGRT
jgi:uncharacterized protein YndB with AHSA1/START domain